MFEYIEFAKKILFGSEDAKGERRASKSRELGSLPSTPAISRPRYWVASHWDNYMARHGWKEYPCAKHEVPFCLECTATNVEGVCVE